MGKGEIARYEQFLLFPQCFQKACFPGMSKGVIVWEWVKAKRAKQTISTGITIAEPLQNFCYDLFRQCMCCFKDYRNFEKLNSMVQDALSVGIRLIQTLPEDNEKELREKRVEKEDTKETSDEKGIELRNLY